MEGVPERMGLPDMSGGKRWLSLGDAADGDSPIEGVKGQKGRQVQPLLTDEKTTVQRQMREHPSTVGQSSLANEP